MTLPDPILYDPSKHAELLPTIAEIHADCITIDGTLATYLPPLSATTLLDFWRGYHDQVVAGSMDIALQMAPANDGEHILAGYVCLNMPFSETGPFRSQVLKLMVSPRHRRKGIARRLMGMVEQVALQKKRELIVLDTTIGSPAEHIYPRFGYKSVGVIPKYGIHPLSGTLVDEIFYYKDLREQAPCWTPVSATE